MIRLARNRHDHQPRVFALHYSITGVSSRRHAATRDYAEALAELRVLAADRTTLISVPRIVQSWGVQK